MRNPSVFRLIVGVLLAAYLFPAILSHRNLSGEALIFKLDSSLSVPNVRSIDLDERPYWTSHRHLTTSEQFLSDHILCMADPLMGVIAPEQSWKSRQHSFRLLQLFALKTLFAHLLFHSFKTLFEILN